MGSFGDQLRRHSVALISLSVALTALAYNTWRNEQTEENRNIRTAGIELLLKLGELEQVVFLRHYDADVVRGNPRIGWAYALAIRDLGRLAPEPVTTSSRLLLDTWGAEGRIDRAHVIGEIGQVINGELVGRTTDDLSALSAPGSRAGTPPGGGRACRGSWSC